MTKVPPVNCHAEHLICDPKHTVSLVVPVCAQASYHYLDYQNKKAFVQICFMTWSFKSIIA